MSLTIHTHALLLALTVGFVALICFSGHLVNSLATYGSKLFTITLIAVMTVVTYVVYIRYGHLLPIHWKS